MMFIQSRVKKRTSLYNENGLVYDFMMKNYPIFMKTTTTTIYQKIKN